MPDVLMPRLSDTMTEGVLSQWLKGIGDEIHKGDVLAEIETDKATMDLEAYDDGVLEQLLVPAGATVPIGAPIAHIGDGSGIGDPAQGTAAHSAATTDAAGPAATTDAARPAATTRAAGPAATAHAAGPAATPAPSTPLSQRQAPPPPPAAPPERAAPTAAQPAPPPPPPPARPPASPLARKIAREHGIDLATVVGTGPGGRVVRADIDAAINTGASAAAPAPATPPEAPPGPPAAASTPVAQDTDEEIPLSAVRRVTARRLTESAAAPHFHLTAVLDAGPLLDFRTELNTRLAAATDTSFTVTDLLVRAAAVTLRTHRAVNSSWAGDKILRHGRIHIGIAVAVEDGLIVPVVRDADRKSLSEIATESRALVERARTGRPRPDELTGSTFTISNLGMYGIDHFTAVINPPEAALLAVGAATEEAVVRDGQVVARPTIKLTLSIDHRVLDGATAARFLRDLIATLEEPLHIVVGPSSDP